jgi:hypothetical protein
MGRDEMPWIVKLESRQPNELYGLIEYYDVVLKRKRLIERESEFRTNKLGLVLDLIGAIDMPDDLRAELISAIIEAWRLEIPEKTLAQREKELDMLFGSIETIKVTLDYDDRSIDRSSEWRLGVMVLSNLPMAPADFRSECVSKIYGLISSAMEYPHQRCLASSTSAQL